MTYLIKKISEICEIQRGGSPRPIKDFITDDENGINWIKIGDTKKVNKFIYKTNQKIKPEGIKRSRMVYPGDFILSNSMSFGKPYIMKTTGCIHDGWLVLRTDKNVIDDNFLYLLLGSNMMYQKFSRASSGTTVKNLSIDKVKDIEIKIPPLSTQKLIVQKLDSAFKNIDESIDIAKNNIKNINELNESVLEGIVNENINNLKTIEEICYKITDGVHNTPTYIEKGVPFLSVKDVTKGFIDFSNTRFISQEEHERLTKRCKPEYGDMLYTKVGTTGYAKSIDVKNEFSIFVSLALLKFDQNILNTKYFEYMLNSSNVYLQSQEGTRGVTNKNLVLRDIKPIKIPVPSLKKQKEIVIYLNEVFEKNKVIKKGYKKKLKDLEEMKQSILKEAFEGRLVKK